MCCRPLAPPARQVAIATGVTSEAGLAPHPELGQLTAKLTGSPAIKVYIGSKALELRTEYLPFTIRDILGLAGSKALKLRVPVDLSSSLSSSIFGCSQLGLLQSFSELWVPVDLQGSCAVSWDSLLSNSLGKHLRDLVRRRLIRDIRFESARLVADSLWAAS